MEAQRGPTIDSVVVSRVCVRCTEHGLDCDGDAPCNQCADLDSECKYPSKADLVSPSTQSAATVPNDGSSNQNDTDMMDVDPPAQRSSSPRPVEADDSISEDAKAIQSALLASLQEDEGDLRHREVRKKKLSKFFILAVATVLALIDLSLTWLLRAEYAR
jgi:hypothetical protein